MIFVHVPTKIKKNKKIEKQFVNNFPSSYVCKGRGAELRSCADRTRYRNPFRLERVPSQHRILRVPRVYNTIIHFGDEEHKTVQFYNVTMNSTPRRRVQHDKRPEARV